MSKEEIYSEETKKKFRLASHYILNVLRPILLKKWKEEKTHE